VEGLRGLVLIGAAVACAAPPQWVSGKWNGCPPSSCWVGIGTGSTADQAREAALADVSRQVRARVRSNVRDSHWEDDGRVGDASSSQSNVRTDEKFDGIQVVESAQDGATWYALATLDRSTLAAPGRAAMDEATKDAIDRIARVRLAIVAHRPQEASEELSALSADRAKFLDGRDRAALGELSALSEEFPLSAPVRDSFQRVLRAGLELSAPDTVAVSRERPDTAQWNAEVRWKGAPVAELDLELRGVGGKVLAQARTDSRGQAHFHPQGVSGKSLTLRVRPGLLASAERIVALRWTGAVRSYRLSPDQAAQTWRTELSQALDRSGWILDQGSQRKLVAVLKTTSKGRIEGLGDPVVRMEAKVSLQAGEREISCAATGFGPDETEATRAAVRKLDCPAP